MRGRDIAVFIFILLSALLIPILGYSEISPHIPSKYVAGREITGSITITLGSQIPDESILEVYIGDSLKATKSLNTYLGAIKPYIYPYRFFNYTINASGDILNYTDENFFWTITASGTRVIGGPWEATQSGSGTVNGQDGLKYITTSSINPPLDHNDDTIWSVKDDNTDVDAEMMMACGGESYDGFTLSSNGWVINRTLGLLGTCPDPDPLPEYNCHTNKTYVNCWCGIPDSSDWETQIGTFGDDSLSSERGRFYHEPIGGIYKDGVYQSSPGQAEWDGSSGYIKVHNFDLNSRYIISYLPPNGDRLCAYTSASETPWSNTSMKIRDKNCRYMGSYQINYTQNQLKTILGIPNDLENINFIVIVEPQQNMHGSITQNPDGNYTLTVYTDSADFSYPLNISVDLGDLSIIAPEDNWDYNMTFYVKYGTDIYFTESEEFGICLENDGDGYAPAGSGCYPEDCNDSNAGIHPGAYDIPNNDIDENCDSFDGIVDSDRDGYNNTYFNGSVWDCNDNNSAVYPGSAEICNSIDDDCDGITDDVGGGNSIATTKCQCYNMSSAVTETCNGIDDNCDGMIDGMKRLCSQNNLGECSSGSETCTNGFRLGCPIPTEEICDERDNDCDGEVDDGIKNKCTDYSTCITYDTCNPCPDPPAEICNGRDDNCNSEIDEGFRCVSGETKVCNSNIGVCREGTMNCTGCSWGPCKGSYGPFEEICGNGLDDDCDAEPDEYDCISDVNVPCSYGPIYDSCKCGENTFSFGYCCDGKWGLKPCEGPSPWIWLSIGGAAILVVLWMLVAHFRKTGRELTWNELYRRWRGNSKK